MGCCSSSTKVAVVEEDPTPAPEDYDERWDRYRPSGARDSDGSPSECESLETRGCSFQLLRLKTMASLRCRSISPYKYSYQPVPMEPEAPSLNPDPSISPRSDHLKIKRWMSTITVFDIERRAGQSVSGESAVDFSSRNSIHTIYTHDDDEELIQSRSQMGMGSPQRLTDKRCINNLQQQLRFQEKKKTTRRRKSILPEPAAEDCDSDCLSFSNRDGSPRSNLSQESRGSLNRSANGTNSSPLLRPISLGEALSSGLLEAHGHNFRRPKESEDVI